MKKRTLAALGALGLLLAVVFLPVSVLADPIAIDSVSVDVDLQDDGSALFTEVWEVNAVDGTEWYIQKPNLDNQTISDFQVSDENGAQFTDIGRWDVDASFEEKTGKCGLVEANGGYELCWGLGSYGQHTYVIRYRMTGLVKGAASGDGVITQMLVPDQLAATVDTISITIRKAGAELSAANSGIWGFGFYGDTGFQDGAMWLLSNQPMRPGTGARVMARFDEGMFSPAESRSETFAEIQEKANEGSDYFAGGESGGNGGGSGEGGTFSSRNMSTFVMAFAFFILFAGGDRYCSPQSFQKREHEAGV